MITKIKAIVQNLKFGAPKSPVSGNLAKRSHDERSNLGGNFRKDKILKTLSKDPKQSLDSFTIMEMLVALTLAGIVIASGGMLYFQFNRYLSASINRNESENAAMLFSLAFRNDINKPGNITAGNGEINIANADNNVISYAFFDDFIIRSTMEVADTFHLFVENLSISTDPATGRFHSVKADLIIEGTVYPFLIVKEYENYELFNKTP
jgi:type II secretory pathway pseudopilin PulG